MSDLLSILNPKPKRLAGPQLLHELVPQSQAEDAVAIEYSDQDGNLTRLSYDDLHARSNALARKLLPTYQTSAPSENGRFIVPLYIPQSPELYISQLAILKAGGAFCPIALDAPEERLRFILQDVKAKVLLTVSNMRPKLPQLDDIVVIDSDEATLEDDREAVSAPIAPHQAAYIMYTSGSTGVPKGVILSHSAATQALLAHNQHIPQFTRFLQFANPTFDVSVFEIFFPLFRGATLISCERRRLLDNLPDVITQLNVDAAELTPSVASSLLHGRNSVPSLKLLLTIGEMLKKSVVEEFAGDSDTAGILYGMYGPTEATIHCTVQDAFKRNMPVNNIGVPLDTVSAFVVKPSTNDTSGAVPEIETWGQEGELAVGGHQLADGYLNRNEQTRAAFVWHPQYGSLYRTGDLARMTPEGQLECLGRISGGQVKLRGQRIELGEIEHAAAQTEGCRSVVADVLDGTLVAFCVRHDISVTEEDIRQTCKKWLPTFMVPGDIVLLDTLPYLASGKIDRKALSELYTELKRPLAAASEVMDWQTQQIATVISEALRVNISPSTYLPGAGLDSLSAIRIASHLHRHGFPRLDASAVLEARSVSDVKEVVARDEQIARSAVGQAYSISATTTSIEDLSQTHSLLASRRADIDAVFPATPVQSAMLSETSSDPQAYCNWVLLSVANGTDCSTTQHAIRTLSDSHPLLRSGFITLQGTAVTHAVVVWRSLLESQIDLVEDLDYHFTVATEEDALHPCSFQLQQGDDGVRVLLKIHHALYDQWSIDVLKADLNSLLQGRAPAPALSFSEVSGFYLSKVEEARSEKVLDFWRDQLQDFSTTPVPNLNGRETHRKLAKTSWSRLSFDMHDVRAQAREMGYSVPALFQAAFAYLLSLYAGSRDVVFGTVFSGRHVALSGIERTFGPCLSTLPCRLDLSSVNSCLDLLRLAHDGNRAMQRHSMTPLAEIKRVAQCAPGTVLFDSLFVWQETSLESSDSGVPVEVVDSADHHEFNLVLEFDPSIAGLGVRATYQESLLPAGHIALILRQLECLAIHLLQHPRATVDSLASSFDHDLLSVANEKPCALASARDFVTAIERQAVQIPEQPAVIFATNIGWEKVDTITLSYAELNTRANQLANFLLSNGVLPDDIVCICMEKSIELYIAILATVKTGAGYLPLLPDTPPARVETILRQAAVRLCLCDTTSSNMVRDVSSATVINLVELDVRNLSNDNLAVKVNGEFLAYTVFTSGSTGQPKGVCVTRENLSGNLAVLAELYQVTPGDRLLQACSQAFDVSVFEIFFALSTGMCLCAATKDTLFQDLERSVRALGITHLSLTPTVAALIHPVNVPSVQFLVTAGEGVTGAVRKKWAGNGLHQGYGPSETTNICTVKMEMDPTDVLGNVGPPLRNTSAFVISSSDELTILPTGAVGELAFGGEQVFRGYLRRDDLNAAKLIDHPDHGRIYRSGDVGRIMCDGSLFITGRLDEQVKLRGNRVELGEINSVMLQDGDVADCATLLFEDHQLGPVLVSFWVSNPPEASPNRNVSVAESDKKAASCHFQRLEATLPSYMIPTLVIPISKIPMTGQGKIDKRLLRQMLATLNLAQRGSFSREADEFDEGGEWSVEEVAIANALARTLEIPDDSVRRTTSFFALGLNSLTAIAFAKALEADKHQRVCVSSILQNPSVTRLAAALLDTTQHLSYGHTGSLNIFDEGFTSRVKEECGSQGLEVESILPCTPLQDAMLSATISKGQSTYQNSTHFLLTGDLAKIKRCWTELTARHAILRTHFVETQSAARPFAQVVVRAKTLPWYSTQSYPNGCDATKQAQVGQEPPSVTMSRPFSIRIGRMDEVTSMTLHMHHAIYDGVSMSVLLAEAEQMYRRTPLSPPPSFEPFLSESLAQSGPKAMRFWSSRLQNYQPKPFPTFGTANRATQITLKQTASFGYHRLEAFCKRYSVTPLSTLQTSWAKVLSCAQQADDICFGSVVSGRSVAVADVERLVAPCFNTIPFRVDLSEQRTNAQLAQRLHTQNIEDLKYQLTSLRHTQTMSKSPHLHLFDSVLLLQPPPQILDSKMWSFVGEEGTMDMPVILEITLREHKLEIALHFENPQISEELARNLLHAFASALKACLRYPSSDMTFLEDFDPGELAGKLQSHQQADLECLYGEKSTGTWTPEEIHVREVFASLSGTDMDRITQKTTMYQLGLDSLNAPQVAARLRKLGLKLDATDVAENLTPSAIAAAVIRAQSPSMDMISTVDLVAYDSRRRSEIARSLRLDAEVIEAVRPCTAVQCGMIAQSLHSRSSLYINHITYKVPETVNVAVLRRAWEAVQQRHQALRMGFVLTEDPKRPFAMLIWKMGRVPETCVIINSAPDSQHIEACAAEKIAAELHVPAWRLSIVQSSGQLAMVLSLHHALYDAESLQILMNDFHGALSSQSLGAATSIDPLLTAALDAESSQTDNTVFFWRNCLKVASFTKFPNLSPIRTNGIEMRCISYKSELRLDDLEKTCKTKGATIQALGQASWALILSSYTGEPDVMFGTVFSGRTGASNQATAFPSISTVPVPCSAGKPYDQIVADMVAYNASVHRYRCTPLSEIQRCAGVAGQRLFDTVFVYQKAASTLRSYESLSMIRETAAVEYVASLELEVLPEGTVYLRLTVDSSQIPEGHAQLLVQQYDYTLAQLIGHISVTAKDHDYMHSILPAKEETLPSDASLLHEFVELQARKHPNKPALDFVHSFQKSSTESKVWSYKQLNERGNQVAHLLSQHGVSEGDIVAVRMSKCAEASFAFLGILKVGCAFLAMDPDLPEARQRFILQDSGASVLFHDQGEQRAEQIADTRLIALSESMLHRYPSGPSTKVVVYPNASCYYLYTSGTTGQPKGCEITHENAVQAMQSFQRLFAGHWDDTSRWLQFASYWFDVSVLEQFWSWSVGITVVTAPRDLVLDDLAGFIQQTCITHIDLTPSLARLLHPDDVPSLHKGVFITGGEALKQEIIDAWGPQHVICNGYGPTEATIGVTMNTFVGPAAKPSNIGRPFDNVGAYVLAPDTDEPRMRGAIGELCVSGKLVGRGYLNRPELTAKAFPYLERFGERVYRTGDLVRMLADDSLSFIGRIDTQTKLRGQRLEIGEIDNVIAASSQETVNVVSLVHRDANVSKETLVSFVTFGDSRNGGDCELDASAVGRQLASDADRACKGRLPGYMVPTHIIPITLLPLTVNNKSDTKRLTALFNALSVQDLQTLRKGSDNESELTVNERRVCHILSDMLALDPTCISRSSNFFSLGMSSVSAITFSSLLKRSGFDTANVASVMQNPTIAQLASALSGDRQTTESDRNSVRQAQLSISAFAQRHRSTVAEKLSVSLNNLEAVTPCTPLQEGLIVESVTNIDRPYFNEFRYLLGNANQERLRKAFERLVIITQMLRARFLRTDDGFAQAIARTADVPLQQPSLSKKQDMESFLDQERKQWLEENQHDLVDPIRAFVILSTNGNILVFFVHHALYDGISWQLLLDRLADSYNRRDLPDCGPSFTTALPYGPLQTQQGAKPFWQRRLAHLCYEAMETVSAQGGEDTSIGTSKISDFESVEATRKQLGVSHQAILQACFEVALVEHYTGTRTYGHVVSGRSIGLDGADQVLGPLFNTLPSAIELGSKDSWSTAIRRLHDNNTAAVPYQHTPLRDIRRWCGQGPSDPMFDVLFVFQYQPERNLAAKKGLWKEVKSELKAEYPLAFEITLLTDNTLEVVTVAQNRVANKASLKKLLQSFEQALDAVNEDVNRLIAEKFSLPDAMERRRCPDQSQNQSFMNGSQGFEWTKQAIVLREVISQIAGLDKDSVDEHSTIFSLGLDSIDAVRLASRVKKAGMALPVSKILQAQTIPRMLGSIAVKQAFPGPDRSSCNFEMLQAKLNQSLKDTLRNTDAIDRLLPATPHQEALIADMLRSDWREYYNHDVLRLQSDIDVGKLQAAWQEVVDSSPILRTGFVQITNPDIDATFAQIIHRSHPVTIREYTLSDMGELQCLLDDITADAKSSHQSNSLRLSLVTMEGERYFILSLAHAQYDGHSLALLHEDIRRAYDHSLEERPPYESIIERALASTSEEARNFWHNSMSGATVSSFPQRSGHNVAITTYRAERQSSMSSADARSFCQKHGVSLQALAQTCWALVVAHHVQSLEVMYGVVLACRDSEEAEQIMFPMMNTVPTRATLHGSRSEMLQYMQDMINDMRPYQRTPLRMIQAACADAVSKGHSTEASGNLFDTLFIYQHRSKSNDDTTPLYESVGGSSNVEYPVAVEMEAVKEKLVFRAACKSTVLDKRDTAMLLDQLDKVLNDVVDASEEPTVAFFDSQVSVCGLPFFRLPPETAEEHETQATPKIDEAEAVDGEPSPVIVKIREALALVAKIPADSISPSATIESLGIDSISAIKVTALLRKQDIKLSVSEIIRAKSVRKMAEIISSKGIEVEEPSESSEMILARALNERGLNQVPDDIVIDRYNVEAVLPATAGQSYMLSVWKASAGQFFYPTFKYELETKVEAEQIRGAWQQLLRHHAALRTVFCATDNEQIPILQVVLKETNRSFYDGSRGPPTDIVRQPLVALYLEKKGHSCTIRLQIHHALYDAVSLPLLMRDFQDLLAGNEPKLPAIKQSDLLALSVTEDAQQGRKGFWTSYLNGAKPVQLRQPKANGAQKRVEIFNPGLLAGVAVLEGLARKAGITIQALLFAVYAKVYAGLTFDGKVEGDVVLGVYLANRSHLPDLYQLAAPTLNLVPLLIRSPKEAAIQEVAKQIQTDLQDIRTAQNSAVGLWEIAEWTGIKVDTCVNFLKLPEQEDEAIKQQSDVVLCEMDERRTTGYSRISQPGECMVEVPKELRNMKVAEAYQYSVDLEAAVANGSLDVGVFCPEEMLGLEEAEVMVEEVKKQFEELMKAA